MPISRSVRMIRTAISPRLAMRTLRNIGLAAPAGLQRLSRHFDAMRFQPPRLCPDVHGLLSRFRFREVLPDRGHDRCCLIRRRLRPDVEVREEYSHASWEEPARAYRATSQDLGSARNAC